jgi:tRNA nucleotidyltransferase (CCA-adding enzyme)
MVASGEAESLVPERVWQEFSRGLMEGDPGLMFPVLAEAGLLAGLLPELKLSFEHGRPANDAARILVRALECAGGARLGLPQRFALVAAHAASSEDARALCERLKAPNDCRDLALLAQRHRDAVKKAPRSRATELLGLLEACDALRRPARFDELLSVCECLERGERNWGETPYPPRAVMRRALGAATGVDAAGIAGSSAKPDIAAKVRSARLAAIEAALC